MMKKKLGYIFAVALLLLSMSGCATNTDKVLKTLEEDHASTVKSDIEVFSDGDISEITERVFGVTADEISSDDSGKGIIAGLFANAEVQVVSADESTISYTIVSPDISNFFMTYAEQLDSITTSEELGQAILEYANTAPTKEYAVTVSYSIVEGSIAIAYDDSDFINAMTGGLLDAYFALYEQYLSEG